MVLWPAVAFVGFLTLTALVIVLGIRSTARYELEKEVSERRLGLIQQETDEVDR